MLGATLGMVMSSIGYIVGALVLAIGFWHRSGRQEEDGGEEEEQQQRQESPATTKRRRKRRR